MKKTLLFGKHAVLAAIENPNRHKYKLYTSNKDFPQSKKLDFQIVYKTNLEITKLIGNDEVHGGYLLECSEIDPLYLEKFLLQTKNKQFIRIAALDQITDPHNVGAIIRSALAFNIDAIILTERHSPKNMATIAKTSVGCLEKLPLIFVTNLAQTIEALKEHNFWIAGLDGNATHSLNTLAEYQKLLIVLGSEGQGLRNLTAKKCDFLVNIPMNSAVESLNVSNAAAICFYEVNKVI